MATVLKAVGATFTASNLVKLNYFVKDGLVAAYRPDNTSQGLTDLSGNGHKLTLVGGASVDSRSLVSSSKLSGASTGLNETASFTYISTFKVEPVGGKYAALPINCFSQLAGGSSIFAGQSGLNDISAQCYSTGVINVIAKTTTTNADYVFVAVSVDAVTNTMRIDIPARNISVTSTPEAGETFSARVFSRFGIHLGYCPSYTAASAKSYIAEAIIYNKALTIEQIAQQYSYSKKDLEAKGIAI